MPALVGALRGSFLFKDNMTEQDPFDKAHPHLKPKKITPMKLHGAELLEYIKTLSDEVDWLSHGFLANNSISMLYATDGIGKSLVGIQGALELASGLPMYKTFETAKPIKVIYCVAERSIKEPLKRIKLMIQDQDLAGKVLFENFTISTELQGRDVSSPTESDKLMEILSSHARNMDGVDLVFFDPLYAMVKGDLKDDKAINAVFNFFRRVGNELDANVFFLHHENRGSKEAGASERTGQDFYGNKFISGLCTAVWHMVKAKDEQFQTIITNEKDSESCLLQKFTLTYDPEFNTVRADASVSSKNRDILIESFLGRMREKDEKFSQDELFAAIGCKLHKVNQRKTISKLVKSKLIKKISPEGHVGIYKAL